MFKAHPCISNIFKLKMKNLKMIFNNKNNLNAFNTKNLYKWKMNLITDKTIKLLNKKLHHCLNIIEKLLQKEWIEKIQNNLFHIHKKET